MPLYTEVPAAVGRAALEVARLSAAGEGLLPEGLRPLSGEFAGGQTIALVGRGARQPRQRIGGEVQLPAVPLQLEAQLLRTEERQLGKRHAAPGWLVPQPLGQGAPQPLGIQQRRGAPGGQLHALEYAVVGAALGVPEAGAARDPPRHHAPARDELVKVEVCVVDGAPRRGDRGRLGREWRRQR